MHFHQLNLGNVSYAVLLLAIHFLNDLKIAQYETFPSSLFWRRTEGELTLFCFTRARSLEVLRCSWAGTSSWCWQRRCHEGTCGKPKPSKAGAVLLLARAAGSPGVHGGSLRAAQTAPVR